MASSAEEMRKSRESGMTLAEIGALHGVSRERVRQVLIDTYGTADLSSLDRFTRARELRASRLAAYRESVLERVRKDPEDPTLTRRRIIDECPVPGVQTADDILDAWTWVIPKRGVPQVVNAVSDEDVIGMLRRAWKASGREPEAMSRKEYDESRGTGDLSGARLVQRFGSWSDACKHAGIPANEALRSYDSPVSAQAVKWVAAYLWQCRSDDSASSAGYDVWARERGGPSLGSVRNVTPGRGWNSMRQQAVAEILRWRKDERTAGEDYPVPVLPIGTRHAENAAVWQEEFAAGVPAKVIAARHGVNIRVVRYYLRKVS